MNHLVKLTQNNIVPFDLTQTILSNENEFKNEAYGLNIETFKKWLLQQSNWANGINLPNGYVPQVIYWFYVDNLPVGMGKIRLKLTESSLNIGGNIGYAIGKPYRGKGYGTIFLKLLIEEAKRIGVNDILLTVEKYNPASKHAIEKAGGILVKENKERWFFTFK